MCRLSRKARAPVPRVGNQLTGLECTRLAILPDLVPLEVKPPTSRYTPVGTTCTSESALRVEQTPGAAERVGDHRAVKYDRFPGHGASAAAVSTIVSVPCVMTMHDSSHCWQLRTISCDRRRSSAGCRSSSANRDVRARTAQAQHPQVRVAERKLSPDFVARLVEGPPVTKMRIEPPTTVRRLRATVLSGLNIVDGRHVDGLIVAER